MPFGTKAEKKTLVTKHRRGLADILDSLSEGDWHQQSLCEGWEVRHVVGHLLSPALSSSWRSMGAVIRNGSFARGADRLAREFGDRQPAELVSLLREHADNIWVSPTMGAGAPLTDILAHTQDIVRPLGIEVEIDPLEIDPALTFCIDKKSNQQFAPARRYAGLRLIATDLKWKFGKGDELEGPALELMMALLGRGVALQNLEGPGFDRFSEQI